MRDPKRLDRFYREFAHLHKTYFPDFRFTQLYSWFLGWHLEAYGNDAFYVEDDKLIIRLKEFFKSVCPNYDE